MGEALFCLSPLLIVYGIILIFFHDLAWEFDKFLSDVSGRESKRTEAWEVMTTISGIVAIIVAIVAIVNAS